MSPRDRRIGDSCTPISMETLTIRSERDTHNAVKSLVGQKNKASSPVSVARIDRQINLDLACSKSANSEFGNSLTYQEESVIYDRNQLSVAENSCTSSIASDITSPISCKEERLKVLKRMEDILPNVVGSMEAANIRIHGFSVAGQMTNELSQSWEASFKSRGVGK